MIGEVGSNDSLTSRLGVQQLFFSCSIRDTGIMGHWIKFQNPRCTAGI